ncbi:MAG: hypothetical protein EAZ08_11715 [Cytophagales bacterium]|nr:MAG: hypothetical protein EAZ08_11715 [Cytophagales bacterium]
MWQPRYSKTIEKKLLALRYKLVAEKASREEICKKSEELILIEQEKARQRRKRKTDKAFTKLQESERTSKNIDEDGCEITFLLAKNSCIVVQQNTLPLRTAVFYSWSLPNELKENNCTDAFTFEGANQTELCTVLPDSYILVLNKLNKNGKKCGKLYIDMFFKTLVKLNKSEL